MDAGLSAQNSFRAYFPCHTRHLRGKGAKLIHHHVDCIFQLKKLAFHIDCDFLGQVAVCYGSRDRRDIADLGRQIAGHQIDVFG